MLRFGGRRFGGRRSAGARVAARAPGRRAARGDGRVLLRVAPGAPRLRRVRPRGLEAAEPARRLRARRNRASSRWHNFRAVVLDEEVASGAVAYDVAVLKLTGGAVAVGVVGEDARVNELNDWVLGLELETAALVAKGPALDREAPFDGLGLFSTARCAACGGDARARPTCSAVWNSTTGLGWS